MMSFLNFFVLLLLNIKGGFTLDFCSLTPAREIDEFSITFLASFKALHTFLVFERRICLTLFIVHLWAISLLLTFFACLSVCCSSHPGISS